MTAKTATPPAATAPSAAQDALNAFGQLVADKTPYVWEGVSQLGADCSGAVKWAFAKAGFTMAGRTAAQQADDGTDVPLAGANKLANAVPGDPLFFDEGGGTIDHEALYAGNGMDFEESKPGEVAHLIPVDVAHLVEIRQFVNAAGDPLAGITGTAVTVAANAPSNAAATAAGASGATTAATTATDTSVFTDLDPANWAGLAAKALFVAGGLGLIVLGATKTASPS